MALEGGDVLLALEVPDADEVACGARGEDEAVWVQHGTRQRRLLRLLHLQQRLALHAIHTSVLSVTLSLSSLFFGLPFLRLRK